MNNFRSIVFAASAVSLGALSAHAAPILYQINVEAELRAVTFGPAVSLDTSSGRYQRHLSMVYSDSESAALDDFQWIGAARETAGSLEFEYDPMNPTAVAPVFSNCMGVLWSMCSGSVARVNLDPSSFYNSDGTSFLTRLSATSMQYRDDSNYSWDDGTHHFVTVGYGVTVTHDISSLSIAAVPLSSSLGFLLAAFGMLVGMRHVSRKTKPNPLPFMSSSRAFSD